MKIFTPELKIPGLAEQISHNNSVAYFSTAKPWEKTEREQTVAKIKLGDFATASLNDPDLYHTKSILCSTNWNKNDDVFFGAPVWEARHTASHKRTNIDHNEQKIVGHITGTWVINKDGELIPDDMSENDLPSFFHIANGAVIYRAWKDDELKARANDLIEAIEAGDMYVSMEALFDGFSYAIKMPTDEVHIIPRNEETSFLTEHLRIYGGAGEYEGCKLGRVLYGITFCGKGYVKRPANPYSVVLDHGDTSASCIDMSKIIIASEKENPFKRQSGVFISSSSIKNLHTESNMSIELEQQNKELQATIASLKSQVTELSQATVSTKLTALESSVAEWKTKAETAEASVKSLNDKVVELTAAVDASAKKVAEVEQAKADLANQLAKIEAEALVTARINTLVSGGYSKEDAEKKVQVFSSLNNEQFNVIAAELIEAKKASDKKMMKDEEEEGETSCSDDSSDPKGEVVANTTSLNTATQSSEPGMATAASQIDAVAEVRKELSQALASRFGRKVRPVTDGE